MTWRVLESAGTWRSQRLRRALPLALAVAWLVPLPIAAAGVQWVGSWAEGRQAMARDRKPGILYFYNERALPCHQMETETFVDPLVVEKMGDFVAIRLQYEAHRDLAQQHGLLKVPTIVFLDEHTRTLDKAVGFKPAAAFVQYLDRIRQHTPAGAGASAVPASGGMAGGMATSFAAGAVDILGPRAGTIPITLSVMAPQARRVTLAGDFNDWRDDATPLTRNSAGVWAVTVHLTEGVYEYLFVADGEYRPDPNNANRRANPYGGFNSTLIVGSPKISPQIDGRTVTFILFDPQAQTVEIACSFNNWQRLVMFRNPAEPGMWGVRYTLPPGTHHYKYIIDGKWVLDPENYAPVDDGSGNMNSSFTVR